ncbi:nitroreductase family protein [uncultured Alistipes sp.]|uniref:nitroreductase family protein n=1 Tax=uncultured Alistipes sp. TaxID=538949 RepID=UPI00345DC129
MNKAEWLNVLLAVAVVILSVKTAFFNQGSPSASIKEQTAEEAVLDNLMTRTSIRAYRDRPVEDEKVETLLRAAMAAPSAGNKQPWKFVVIKDKQILKSLSEHFNTMKMAEHAPLAIVVCGDMEKTFPADGRDYWVEDTSAASENLLLAAHAMGLGAVWCGIYPMQERVAWLKQLLRLPENIVPLNVIPIGYPAEDPAPKDKWDPAHIHYETWDGAADATAAPTQASARSEPAKWTKVAPAELRENPFTLFSDALALSVGSKDRMNAMTIGWGGLGVLWGKERPVVTVYVEKRRYTHAFMEENEYFTVEAFAKDYDRVLKYLGTVSGRDEDKMKGSGLTVGFTDLGTPFFEEGRLVLECRKLYGAPFDPEGFGELARKEYSNRPLHSIYIGEIVNAWIRQ